MMQTKDLHTAPSDTESMWTVVPNPDPPNSFPTCNGCNCPVNYAVKHSDGGIIRFYNGKVMDRQLAEKLKQELELQT